MTRLSSTYINLEISVSGVTREVEADVSYIHSPASRGYREKGGGQIDPDEPERAEVQSVIIRETRTDSAGGEITKDILYLLTDEQEDAIESEIIEQGA